MINFQLRHHVLPEDKTAIESILRSSGAFRDEEVAVGLDLLNETLHPRPDTDYEWILAERDEAILGFACYGPVPMTDGTFDLYWIAVAPEARGTAVASELDNAAEIEVQRRAGRWIIAETSSTDPYAAARRFYLKQGYRLIERIPDYYRDGDDRMTFGKRIIN